MVQSQRAYSVDWRFISLRLLNEHVDYATHFPPEYEASHTAGLRLLRLAAHARAEAGRDAVGGAPRSSCGFAELKRSPREVPQPPAFGRLKK